MPRIDSYQSIIEEFPQHGDLGLVYLNLANLLHAADQRDQAEAAYRKGIELVGNNANVLNNFAWGLATAAESKFHQSRWAVELAKKAVELAPGDGNIWNTLGVAQYRAGDWKAAIEGLEKSLELQKDNSFDFFFLAMAHWQLGNKEEAHKWYRQAVDWMEKNNRENFEYAIGFNNNDQVAFRADLDAGGQGIFTGPDPVADKVIQLGDPLFGSNVTGLLEFCGLNDNGDVVFTYELANGISGMAVARREPPRPGDLDLDSDVDFDDIDDFVLGLNEPAAYESLFGVPPSLAGDTDGDGDLDFDDIDDFAAILGVSPLSGAVRSIPEPGAATLAGVRLVLLLSVGRRRPVRPLSR